MAMKEIRQREKELKITQDEWFAAWMLIWIRKRKKIDNHELQSLWDVVKKEEIMFLKTLKISFRKLW